MFSESALAVFDDRSLPRDIGLSGLFTDSHAGDSFNVEAISSGDFSASYGSFTQHQFAFDARGTYPTPPPNFTSSPGLMPPPPLPFKVQQHRHQHQDPQRRRRRSSGLESCDSNLERPPSASSISATSPTYQQSVVGSPGSLQSRQYPSPRSPDGQPTHQSPEEFQSAVQIQDPSATEASDSLFKDWMHVNYVPSPLATTDSDDDDENTEGDEDGDPYGRSDESAVGSDDSAETIKAYRNRLHETGEFLQWGSDSNFRSVTRHYTPGPMKETVESMHEFQLTLLKCLQVSQNEEVSSVYDNEVAEPPRLRTNPSAVFKTSTQSIKPESNQKEEGVKSIRFKRRKMQGPQQQLKESGTAEHIEDGDMAEVKPKPPSGGRRRRRRNREAKNWPTRPVLTDEQRRQNHIKSEKKRRILINEGFDDLCTLVPSLGKGKFCKSTVLQLAGQWLEGLLEGNQALKKQLSELKGEGNAISA